MQTFQFIHLCFMCLMLARYCTSSSDNLCVTTSLIICSPEVFKNMENLSKSIANLSQKIYMGILAQNIPHDELDTYVQYQINFNVSQFPIYQHHDNLANVRIISRVCQSTFCFCLNFIKFFFIEVLS